MSLVNHNRARLVVLDRDGVINRDSPDYVKAPEEWIPLPGSLEAIARLSQAGFQVVVASNQSGVGRGLFTLETLAAIHRKMHEAVAAAGGHLAGVFFCPHTPEAGCACRKPRPGLLRRIETVFGQTLAGQPVIGDSARDLEAARAVAARPILVRTGNGRRTAAELADSQNIETFDDLASAAAALLREVD